MIIGQLVHNEGSHFAERIWLFLEFPRFLEISYFAYLSLRVQLNVTPPVFEELLTVFTGSVRWVTAKTFIDPDLPPSSSNATD
jgi:hypothetical protein